MLMRFMLLMLAFTSLSSQAQTIKENIAFAVIGEPKYAVNFTHFDYVNPAAPKGGKVTLSATGTFDNFNRYALRGVAAARTESLYDTLFVTSDDEPGIVACVVAIGLMTVFINPVFAFLTRIAVSVMSGIGLNVTMPELQPDAFPFWDSCMMVLSIAAMILMTRKYVENWLLWVIINVISVAIFALQGVYAMSLEYLLLTFIALNGSRMWINSARERGSRALSS